MTQDEIIQFAHASSNNWEWYEIALGNKKPSRKKLMFLTTFAKFVAYKERKACAKIADEWAVGWPHPSQVIAERIRERNNHD
jgi:hypothetical protein